MIPPPDLGEWADRYDDNPVFRAIANAIAADDTGVREDGEPNGVSLAHGRKAQAVMLALMQPIANSDTYDRLSVPQQQQARAVAVILRSGCGAYVGSATDIMTDASHIVTAVAFAPPLGDNHHNAGACPFCSPPEPTGPCVCGHARDAHIYNEGKCRPGSVCSCNGYEERAVTVTPSG